MNNIRVFHRIYLLPLPTRNHIRHDMIYLIIWHLGMFGEAEALIIPLSHCILILNLDIHFFIFSFISIYVYSMSIWIGCLICFGIIQAFSKLYFYTLFWFLRMGKESNSNVIVVLIIFMNICVCPERIWNR